MQHQKYAAIALIVATSFAPACGTRTGVAIAGGTILGGIVLSAAINNENYNQENAFRPTNEIAGVLMILTGFGMLAGNLVMSPSKPSSKPPARVRPVVAPQAFAAPSRRISTQLQALIDFALTAARDNRCSDAQSLAVHAAAIDATYVEATLANDAAMRRCAEPQAQR